MLETSVFRIAGLEDQEIWDIGERDVAQKSNRHLHGRADILADKVLGKGLNVNPDKPPSRHANIMGWPEEESRRMSIAQELAADSQLHLK